MDALSPIAPSGAAPFEPVRVASPQAPASSFAAILERQMSSARAEIDGVRAEIASLRDGGARSFAANAASRASTDRTRPMSIADLATRLRSMSTGDAADPYGWRQMARSTGEAVIGAGYGAIFERQIQQESGFAPDVVFGLRKSSAGAEGIAQLMTQ